MEANVSRTGLNGGGGGAGGVYPVREEETDVDPEGKLWCPEGYSFA